MRIDKLLANMGYGSRKEVKNMLKKGNVLKNGEVIKSGKSQVDPNKDKVTLFDEEVEYKEHIYLMMNKPPGYISATEDSRERTVLELLQPEDLVFAPFPVGRLDKDTEGLLLLTDDGKFAHQLLSPKKEVGKVYFARINGEVTETDVQVFKRGVTLDDGYQTKPAVLHVTKKGPVSEVEVTITEGKFHQVKRMFEAVEKKVIYLKRIAMGELPLDEELGTGEYRELTDEEVAYLKNIPR